MGRQIIKQPNGLYAEWSSVVDDFVTVDATPEEIAAGWIDDESKRITERVQEVVADLNKGRKPYFQFTMSYPECLERIREVHGGDTESLRMLGEADQPKETKQD